MTLHFFPPITAGVVDASADGSVTFPDAGGARTGGPDDPRLVLRGVEARSAHFMTAGKPVPGVNYDDPQKLAYWIRDNVIDIDYLGSAMPPPEAVAGTYVGPCQGCPSTGGPGQTGSTSSSGVLAKAYGAGEAAL